MYWYKKQNTKYWRSIIQKTIPLRWINRTLIYTSVGLILRKMHCFYCLLYPLSVNRYTIFFFEANDVIHIKWKWCPYFVVIVHFIRIYFYRGYDFCEPETMRKKFGFFVDMVFAKIVRIYLILIFELSLAEWELV